MFNLVHERKRLVQIVLLIVILPFTLWGVDSFRQSGDGDALATVGGEKITQQQFDQALRQQQESMREAMGSAYDPAMFDSPERKRAILENLIDERLLMSQAQNIGLTVNDRHLAEAIMGIKAFQSVDGKFDRQIYESVLRLQKMSSVALEANIARQLGMNQLTNFYMQNGYASRTVADNLVRLSEQQRVVAVAQISPGTFLAQAKIDETAVKNYYDTHQNEFQTDEQARVEYVIFSAESLQSQASADDEEIQKYYEEHLSEFGTQEQRRAAHILIPVTPQASDADKQSAKTRAEQILRQAKQSPDKFAELARQHSQDPGSAANGGDLGMFGRGAMVKPFEEAAFGLKTGEISGLVLTDYGYHIIKMLEVAPAKVSPLAEVKGAIAQKIKLQKANDKFAELAEKFSTVVYEESDTLKSAAEIVNMPVQQSAWLSRKQPGMMPWTDKALQAVFADEVLKDKRNSAAVEIAPDTLLAARLLEHKPASVRSFAEVSDGIRQKLLRQQAADLAIQHGKTLLDKLQRGEKASVEWKTPMTVTRNSHAGLDSNLARRVFQVNAAQFPVYIGVENPQSGYVLARLDEIRDVADIDSASREQFLQRLRQLTGDSLYKSYLVEAREDVGVSVKGFTPSQDN